MTASFGLVACGLLAALTVGCSSAPTPLHPVSVGDLDPGTPAQLCVDGAEAPCRPMAAATQLLADEPLAIEGVAQLGETTQGALVLGLRSRRTGMRFMAKWRPRSTASLINEPVKEVLAYHLQQLALAPADYVVPPAALRCFDEDAYAPWVQVRAEDLLPEAECVFGVLSYWIEGAVGLQDARREGIVPSAADPSSRDAPLYVADAFSERGPYAHNVANLNVVTFLIDHGDPHAAQFMVYPDSKHWFVVDNTVALESLANPLLLLSSAAWNMQVPAIPEQTAAHLGEVERDDVAELTVITEHVANDAGLHRREAGPAIGGAQTHLRREGRQLQLGLTSSEVDSVYERVRELQRRLADGDLSTF